MNTIVSELLRALREHRAAVLVTVIAQTGSSPRGVGAQMLVDGTGRLAGSVGGGAVELGCVRDAQALTKEKRSCERFFSLRQDAPLGMVCGGDVTAWMQYIDPDDALWHTLAAQLCARLAQDRGGWLVLDLASARPALLDEAGKVLCGTTEEAVPVLPRGGALRAGNTFFLPLPVRERAVIFGGGHCAQALVPVLAGVGFRVTVMEDRPDYADPALFPAAEAVLCGDYARIADTLTLTEEDYVVVMTNGHSGDLAVQLQVLRNVPVYIGVIGSRSKKAYVNAQLRAAGISESAIARVHSPIGTAIRAVTPEEIAISIAGEMICERALAREARGFAARSACPMHEGN